MHECFLRSRQKNLSFVGRNTPILQCDFAVSLVVGRTIFARAPPYFLPGGAGYSFLPRLELFPPVIAKESSFITGAHHIHFVHQHKVIQTGQGGAAASPARNRYRRPHLAPQGRGRCAGIGKGLVLKRLWPGQDMKVAVAPDQKVLHQGVSPKLYTGEARITPAPPPFFP